MLIYIYFQKLHLHKKKISLWSKRIVYLIHFPHIYLGANLRTGCQGIFPLAHVVDIEYNEFDPSNHGGCLNTGGMMGRPGDGRKERYLLNYLGSIESSLYKGNVVLCQAVRKIVSSKQKPNPHPTVLEISDKGIKIVDKSKFNVSDLEYISIQRNNKV